MGIVTWILVGALSGVVASFIAGNNKTLANIIIGAAGACLGGWIATLFGIGAIASFNWLSALIALGAAVVLLVIFCLVMRSRDA